MITLLNIFGVRVVALINNTGVLFELLGLFVFAIILALFNNNQGVGRRRSTPAASTSTPRTSWSRCSWACS